MVNMTSRVVFKEHVEHNTGGYVPSPQKVVGPILKHKNELFNVF